MRERNLFSVEKVPGAQLQLPLLFAKARISDTSFATFFRYALKSGVGPDSIVQAKIPHA